MSNLSLSVSGNTVAQLQEYIDSLKAKTSEALDLVSGFAEVNIEMNLGDATETVVRTDKAENRATVIAECPDNSKGFNLLLAVEFGAGIHYNNGNVNPYQGKFGMGVATWNTWYPENALNPDGWWYEGDDGQRHHSYGTKALMPMASTVEAIQRMGADMVRSVFG